MEFEYEVVTSADVTPYRWRVEATSTEAKGDSYVVLFSGPHAEHHAREYVAWKKAPEGATR